MAIFKLHFMQSDVSGILDENTINTIYSIYKKQYFFYLPA
jgi:N-acetylmuramoyl-L-alanine amidase